MEPLENKPSRRDFLKYTTSALAGLTVTYSQAKHGIVESGAGLTLRALKQINYQGGLLLECVWTDFDAEITRGIAVVKQQLAEV